jgi:catechol 2,3-dioxygenase-like lactoylglutathione lyase family enzyme
MTDPTPSLLVIYAQDVARVAAFYRDTLSRPIVAQDAGFAVVGDAALEVAVVRMPEALAAANPLGTPPRVREETPLKPSFLVDDLAGAAAAAAAAGGGTKSGETAWRWRGQLHLDGHDPEGNPVQFRVRDAAPLSDE